MLRFVAIMKVSFLYIFLLLTTHAMAGGGTAAGGFDEWFNPRDHIQHIIDEKTQEEAAHPKNNALTNIEKKCHLVDANGHKNYSDALSFFATKEQAAGVMFHLKDAARGMGRGGVPYDATYFYRTNKVIKDDPAQSDGKLSKEDSFDNTKNPISTAPINYAIPPATPTVDEIACTEDLTNDPTACSTPTTFKDLLDYEWGQVSFQDQLTVALYGSSNLNSGDALTTNVTGNPSFSADYLKRGELLAYHPFAQPINLMVWCVAYEAQQALPLMVTYAVRLFSLLMVIEFAWMTINYVIKANDIGQLMDALISKAHTWALVGSFILTGYYGFSEGNWGYAVFSSFDKIGSEAVDKIYANINSGTKTVISSAGTTTPAAGYQTIAGESLSPGSYFALGILLLNTVWEKLNFNIFNPLNILYIFLVMFITPIIISIFSKMVADICLVILE